MNRAGYTFVELMTVMTIIGILASIAVPSYGGMRRRATAATVIADFNVIRGAAYDQYATSGTYPANSGWGQVPRAFVKSLPAGFDFRNTSVTYRWRRWALPSGMPRNARQTVLLGVELRTSDAALLKAIRALYDGPQAFGTNTQVVLVIE